MTKGGFIMKKYFFVLTLMLMMSSTAFASYDITNPHASEYISYGAVSLTPDPSKEDKYEYMYANHEYPIVGIEEGTSGYYLDKKSCTYRIENGIAYVSCLVYTAGGGADAYGNAAKYTPYIYTFSTYMLDAETRKIFIDKVENANTHEDWTYRFYQYDNGYLKGLFWKVCRYTGLSQFM